MTPQTVGRVLYLIVFISLMGCSTLTPQKKESWNPPKIIEEDVADSKTGQPKPELERPTADTADPAAPYAGASPGQPSVGEPPTGIPDPANMPPRRIWWKDEKGSNKSWKTAPK